MSVTIEHVAAVAGVSPGTVSRALSPKGYRIRAETRARVLAATHDLNYMPSASARILGSRDASTFTVGVYHNHGTVISTPTGIEMLVGLEDKLSERGYHLLLAFQAQESQVPRRIFAERTVDGMIIAHDFDGNVFSRLRNCGVPVVLSHAQMRDDCDSLTVDNEDGVRQCVERLSSLGHRDIAYINNVVDKPGTCHLSSIEAREIAYVRTMADFGLACFPGYDRHGDPPEYLERYFRGEHRPTALVCYDDVTAVAALRWLSERGMGVPRDVSVIGFNDSEAARSTTPRLASVRLPMLELGRRAAEVLLQRIEQPDGPYVKELLKEHLVVRDSIAPPVSGG